MKLIDIGVNLTHKSFEKDRDAVLERAFDVGVTAMVLTGTSVEESARALELTRAHPRQLFSTAGVHPHNSASCDDETVPALRKLAAAPSVVAIGECGLDFNRDFSPRPVQELRFHQQLELAAELGLPLFLHERDAHQRFLAILREHRDAITKAVVHCFTGSPEQARAYLDLDLHIGVTGWVCDERRGAQLQAAVPLIPTSKLMLETDAPFLTPRDLRPRRRRNEPECLPHIAAAVAHLKQLPTSTIAMETTMTATTFFNLPTDANERRAPCLM